MSSSSGFDPLVGALHKSAFQDLVTNLQLEMVQSYLGGDGKEEGTEPLVATLKDLPDPATTRGIIARALARMKHDEYRIIISGDMILLQDTGNDKQIYQRQAMPQAVVSQSDVDAAGEKVTPIPSIITTH